MQGDIQSTQKLIGRHFRQFHSADCVHGASRRSFFRHAFGAAGLALTSESWIPRTGEAKNESAEPRPIPSGASVFGILVHHFPLPANPATPLTSINDPSEITDFKGLIAATQIRGGGMGTGFSRPLAFRCDMGVMKGKYIGMDGLHHHGTFVFI